MILTAVAIGAFVVASGLDDDSETESIAAATDVVSGTAAGDGSDEAAESADDAVDPAGAEATTDSADGDATSGDQDDDGGDGGAMADGDDTEGTTDGDTTGTTAEDGADPAGPGVDAPADVTVLVLNGAGAKGIAGRGSAILDEAGYDVLAPRNADFLGPSLVLYAEGFEEEAAAVAEAFGADVAAVVQALDPSDPPINDTRDANIVVVVGEDGLIDV